MNHGFDIRTRFVDRGMDKAFQIGSTAPRIHGGGIKIGIGAILAFLSAILSGVFSIWVVAVTNQGCSAAIAINAFTGRFGGGGVGSDGSPSAGCDLVPGAGEPETNWFQPRWG